MGPLRTFRQYEITKSSTESAEECAVRRMGLVRLPERLVYPKWFSLEETGWPAKSAEKVVSKAVVQEPEDKIDTSPVALPDTTQTQHEEQVQASVQQESPIDSRDMTPIDYAQQMLAQLRDPKPVKPRAFAGAIGGLFDQQSSSDGEEAKKKPQKIMCDSWSD